MANKKILAAAALGVTTLVGGGFAAATAYADSPSPTPSASSSTQPGSGATTGSSGSTGSSQQGGHQGNGQAPQHTAVTGSEADKVVAAVKAKDASFTSSKVEKDGDGSYDVEGTSGGANVRYEVSADLATVTKDNHQGKGGQGGGSQDAAVTGSEAQKVIDAVQAKDSAAKITTVQKDADGSYDAIGTKNGANVAYDVSADLGTITERAAR